MASSTNLISKGLCFHCGNPGHSIANCPSLLRGEGQSNAGLEALQRFVSHRKELRKKNGGKREKVNLKGPLFHLTKLKYWMKQNQNSEQGESKVYDPLVLAKQSDECNFVNHAYREFFSHVMNFVEKEFAARMIQESLEDGASTKDIANQFSPKPFRRKRLPQTHNKVFDETDQIDKTFHYNYSWQLALNKAVKDGIPANFSNKPAIRVYAYDKLFPRVRYLHHLVMDRNEISDNIRKKLLLPEPYNVESGQVRVCAIGDGPGYDHIALGIVSSFLYQSQCPKSLKNHLLKPKMIVTQAFDLFDKDWSPIMSSLNQSYRVALSKATMRDEDHEYNNLLVQNPTLNHCDIRLSLDNAKNKHLNDALPNMDIISFQYILHENSRTLLPNYEKQSHAMPYEKDYQNIDFIRGAMFDILQRARVGAFILCTDSNNFVWPILKKTATVFGWNFVGDFEKEESIALGPKSFVILERVKKRAEEDE